MKLCKAWGTSFSLIPFLRCGCEPWKWPPTAWGCHPDKWGIPVFWFGQPYFLKNDGVSKSREQITSHLFCKIMLATTFHSPSASASYIYVNWDTQALSKGIYLYIYKNIYTYRARTRAHIYASSDRQSPQRAECLFLLLGGTNWMLMRDEDIRKLLGKTTSGNHLCVLFQAFLIDRLLRFGLWDSTWHHWLNGFTGWW